MNENVRADNEPIAPGAVLDKLRLVRDHAGDITIPAVDRLAFIKRQLAPVIASLTAQVEGAA